MENWAFGKIIQKTEDVIELKLTPQQRKSILNSNVLSRSETDSREGIWNVCVTLPSNLGKATRLGKSGRLSICPWRCPCGSPCDVGVITCYLQKEPCRCDYFKDLEMGRWSWIIWVSPRWNHKCFSEREAGWDLTTENPVWGFSENSHLGIWPEMGFDHRQCEDTEQRFQWCGHEPRETSSPQELEESENRFSPVASPEGVRPADTLILITYDLFWTWGFQKYKRIQISIVSIHYISGELFNSIKRKLIRRIKLENDCWELSGESIKKQERNLWVWKT